MEMVQTNAQVSQEYAESAPTNNNNLINLKKSTVLDPYNVIKTTTPGGGQLSFYEGGPRYMKMECQRARSGWRLYYNHRMFDSTGAKLYELLSITTKSLILKDNSGTNVLSTAVKFPFKRFELHITAPVAIMTAIFNFKTVRKSQTSIELDGSVYKPGKLKSHGHRTVQWTSSSGEIMASQTKQELVFSPKCSKQLERAIIFAICFKCLHHDNN